MRDLLERYEGKLVSAGLAEPGAALLGGLDDVLEWNREDPACAVLARVVESLDVNSILFARPAGPYWRMASLLASGSGDAIHPSDCESRTFLHDIPVAGGFDPGGISAALRRRKTVFVPGRGIVTCGSVSPEQAYIYFSSACFSVFVKFFTDYWMHMRSGSLTREWRDVFGEASGMLDELPLETPVLAEGPFESEEEVLGAIAEAGRATVALRLVDSFFGNISYELGGTLYISQTTSSLDELEGAVDPCPLDGSACTAITASSEYSAHVEVLRRTGARGVLHGHPKFSVVMSMICDEPDCPGRGSCHLRCPRERSACGVPIVPGEVGTGPAGLCNTLPAAMESRGSAIVYGHGLFTLARDDFNGALGDLMAVERGCRDLYMRLVE